MNCKERPDLLLLYVADALDPAERGEIEEHLATGCPTCAAALAEARATFAAVALSLEPLEASPEVKQQLLSRIDAKQGAQFPQKSSSATAASTATRAASPDELPDSAALRLFRLLVPAAVAAGLAVIITHAVMMRQVRSLESAQLRANALQMIVDQREREIDELRQQLDRQAPVLALLKSPTSGIARLSGKNQPQASAELVWDSASRESVLLTSKLTPPPQGRIYELWFITDSQHKLAAGTFDVNADGVATMQSSAPPPTAGTLVAAAVTDEPIGGVDAPTGQIQLVGKLR